MKVSLLVVLVCFLDQSGISQLILNADGQGETYSLITSKLAPGKNPIEVPDCGHGEFGEHIDEIYDSELGANVFQFHIHTNEDDDRCINTDRQRCEIKTYDQSPDSLLGVEGEVFIYKWKFKLGEGFQSSPNFTHIHQLKAVGGPEAFMPLITLTTRVGSPDKLELRCAENTTQVTLQQTDLSSLIGVWCEVEEYVEYGEEGKYSITITELNEGDLLFDYTNNNIRMWKTDAEFIRPKWGIYRSLIESSYLRDEIVLFANFYIEENPQTVYVVDVSFVTKVFPNPTSGRLAILGLKKNDKIEILNIEGLSYKRVLYQDDSIDLSWLDSGLYLLRFEVDGVETIEKIIIN